MSDAPLELDRVSHTYGDVPVLNDVTLSVARGELVSVLGPSGCGKTTLLRSVAGLTVPTAGRILIAGQEVCCDGQDRVRTERRGVGLVFQSYALFGHMTVAENVAFGLSDGGPARVQALLDLTGLGGFAARRPSELSGGQQQRVALARALAPRPHVLLLDEPFANVDAALREELTAELRRMLADEGTTALLVTHDREDALRAADRVAVFSPGPQGGTLQQCGAPEEVYRRPTNEAVACLTGSACFLSGQASGESVETSLGSLGLSRSHQGQVRVLLRPEQVCFDVDEAGPLIVSSCIFAGRRYRVACTLDGQELVGEAVERVAVGQKVRASVDGVCWAIGA